VDSSGATLDFLLSAKQDAAAAKRFLAKALSTANHPTPRVINTDKHGAYPRAIVQLKDAGVLAENCQIDRCSILTMYWNRIIGR
jgi:transposase, IS6 family